MNVVVFNANGWSSFSQILFLYIHHSRM